MQKQVKLQYSFISTTCLMRRRQINTNILFETRKYQKKKTLYNQINVNSKLNFLQASSKNLDLANILF